LFGDQQNEDSRCLACFEMFNKINIDRRNKNILTEHKDFLLQNLTVIPAACHEASVPATCHGANMPAETKLATKTFIKGMLLKLTNIGVIGVAKGELQKEFTPLTENLAD
jgi:hypothetical protein